jgi:hypothetical protein
MELIIGATLAAALMPRVIVAGLVVGLVAFSPRAAVVAWAVASAILAALALNAVAGYEAETGAPALIPAWLHIAAPASAVGLWAGVVVGLRRLIGGRWWR